MQSPLAPPTPLVMLARRLRRHRWALLVVATVAVGIAALAVLAGRAGEETRARKPALALAFEAAPAAWLANPRLPGDFRRALERGDVVSVGVATAARNAGTLLLYTLRGGERHSTVLAACGSNNAPCEAAGRSVDRSAAPGIRDGADWVPVDIDPRTASQSTLEALTGSGGAVLAVLLGVAALGWVGRVQQGSDGGGRAGCLAERPPTRFDDVVGAAEAKAGLMRVKAFLTDTVRYGELGARAPRGVLLQGPPGTGKTLLAKALAGECGAHFIAVDGSYFTSMFFGTGVAKVRQLFALARKHAPCVLFIDEIDGIGRRSTGEMRGGESELNRIINRVLTEMDGFDASVSVVVVGATNHVSNLDPALLRAGRFDQHVQVAMPTVLERGQLFDRYLRSIRAADAIDVGVLARMTSGMSPADVAATVNQAASTAAEQGAALVLQEHLLQAIETRQLGGEVAAATMSVIGEATRRRIAHHEAGHALVGHLLGAGRVERVSIEARGPALGVTYMTREREEPLYAEAELTARLAMMLGGREAELLGFGDVSSGASDDLKRASELAVQMVSTLGFSTTFGLLSVAGVPKELIGPDVQAAALREARALLESAQRSCRDLFEAHRSRLEALAEALLERDIVSGPALLDLLEGRMPASGEPASTGRVPPARDGSIGASSRPRERSRPEPAPSEGLALATLGSSVDFQRPDDDR